MTMKLPPAEKRERLIRHERRQQLWWFLGTLAVGVGLAAWQDVPMVYILGGIAAWFVIAVHLSFTEVILQIDEANWHLTIQRNNRRES